MEVHFTYYGRLAEITGKTSETLSTQSDTAKDIKALLGKQYPALLEMTFTLAANHSVLGDEDKLNTNQVDVFPPFSGG